MDLPLDERAILFLDDDRLIVAAETHVSVPKGHVFFQAWASQEVLDAIHDTAT
jgi:hypothetical protein